MRQASIENDPEGYSSGRMAVTDVARGVILSFGVHRAQSVMADTWEWGGSQWTPRDPARVPAWRQDALFVHDPDRRRTVMFGGIVGIVNGGPTNETWEWDGASWTLRTLPAAPSPRGGCAGAYDAARQRLVMFGGGQFADTWEFDGATWTPRFPANAPSARRQHGMVYDPVRQRVLLHGGNVNGAAHGDTWEWDGANWSLRANYGPYVKDHAMVWDRQRNRAVVVGYWPQVGPGTWEWDGVGWSTRALNLPFQRHVNAVQPVLAAVDPVVGSALVFAQGVSWVWTGSAWLAGTAVPRSPRGEWPAPHCTDTLRNRVVVASSKEGTWEWDGAAWTLAGNAPGFRRAAMAFDANRGLSVLFGGFAWNYALSNATLEWNGATWTQRTFSNQPAPRSDTAMAYDAARQRIVLFGGMGTTSLPQPPPLFGDTWTYDGSAWTQRAGGPSARTGHAMAYDASRQTTVLWGGGDWNGPAAATVWEWNGASWQPRNPATTPPLRHDAALAFDPTRGVVVMAAGLTQQGQNLDDTWSWDGTQWAPIQATPRFQARSRAGMEFDPVRQQLLLFGGFLTDGSSNCCERLDAAVLQANPVAPMFASVGTGCAAGSPPRLNAALPYLGNQDFTIELLDAAPNTVGLVGISFQVQAQPLGPCTLYLQGTPVVAGLSTNAYGVAQLAMPLPNAPSFAGVQLVAQGAALASPGAHAGLDLTAARVLLIGH